MMSGSLPLSMKNLAAFTAVFSSGTWLLIEFSLLLESLNLTRQLPLGQFDEYPDFAPYVSIDVSNATLENLYFVSS